MTGPSVTGPSVTGPGKRRPARSALGLLVLAGLVLGAGCSGGPDPPSGRRSAGGAADAGILRVGLESPRSLDPARATLPSELLVADQLFDGLTTYDAATLAVRPSVAATWASTPDQRHWDFQIRPGAVFSNGRPITSGDVKFSLERVARKGSGASPRAVVGLQSVAGFAAFSTEDRAPGLSGISAPAPDRLHIDLDQPQASLPTVLGNPMFGIVPRESEQGVGAGAVFAFRPVGSGPFQIQSVDDRMLRLVPSPGSPARVKELDLVLEPDVGASYAAFTRGGLDWTAVPPNRVEEAAERYGRAGFRPYGIEVLYGFNLKNPKFADPRYREAIVKAVDRDAIVKVVYAGNSLPLSGLVPDGFPGHQADPCGDRCRHDPAGARLLLAQAFAGRRAPPVQIDYEEDATQDAVAKSMQANLTEVGIPTVIQSHPYPDYLKFATSGRQELFHFISSADYPSPDSFLAPLFVTGRPENVTQFSAPPVDQLLKRAQSEPDEATRTGFVQDAERQIVGQLPVVPIAQYEIHTVVSRRVQGLVVSPLGTFDASQVTLASGR